MGRIKLVLLILLLISGLTSCENDVKDLEKSRYTFDQAIGATEISLDRFRADLTLRQQDSVQTVESIQFNLKLNKIFENHYKLNLYLVELIEDNYELEDINLTDLSIKLREFKNTIDSLSEGNREHLRYHLSKLNYSYVKFKFKNRLDRETFLTEKLLSVHLVTLKSLLLLHGKGPRLIREIQKDSIRKVGSVGSGG